MYSPGLMLSVQGHQGHHHSRLTTHSTSTPTTLDHVFALYEFPKTRNTNRSRSPLPDPCIACPHDTSTLASDRYFPTAHHNLNKTTRCCVSHLNSLALISPPPESVSKLSPISESPLAGSPCYLTLSPALHPCILHLAFDHGLFVRYQDPFAPP